MKIKLTGSIFIRLYLKWYSFFSLLYESVYNICVMRKLFGKVYIILLSVFCLLTGGSCTSEPEKGNAVKVRERTSSGTASYDIYYRDDYFQTDGGIYQPSLATCSYGLAIASFAYYPYKDDYRLQYKNALDFLKATGFENIEYNENYKLPTSYDSLSMIIGRKTIIVDDEDVTLLAVTVKSNGYRLEWLNNMDIGYDDDNEGHHHKGFYDSSLREYAFIQDYISSNHLSGKTKIWMSGFSRGAALTNMTAGLIDQRIVEKGSGFEDVDLGYEDVYAYCFESPQGVYYDETCTGLKDPRNEAYNNIFCMLDENDIVTLVAMPQLGFTRYGHQMYYPNNLNDSDYQERFDKMIRIYSSFLPRYDSSTYYSNRFKITTYTPAGSPEIRIINPNLGLFAGGFVNDLVRNAVYDRETYMNQYYDSVCALLEFIYTGNMSTSNLLGLTGVLANITDENNSRLLVEDIIHDSSAFISDFSDFISAYTKDKGSEMNAAVLAHLKTILDLVTKSTDLDKSFLLTMISMNNTAGVISNCHFPSCNIAWLMAMDPNYSGSKTAGEMSDGVYRKLTVTDCLSLRVKDSSGRICAEIDQDTLNDHGSGLTMGTGMDGGYYVYLPMNMDYTYEINAGSHARAVTEQYDPVTSTLKLLGASEDASGKIPG